MSDELLDLYSDYLICSFGQATATGLGQVVEGSVSHDQITRSLSGTKRTGAELWRIAKPLIRKMQSDDGVMIVDDTVAEKPHSDENDIVCWHYDHTSGKTVKGIGLMTALYHSNGMSLPAEFQLIAKTEVYLDPKDGKSKRRSPVSKNERYRQMLRQATINQIPFTYVLNDVWFASAENMNFVKYDLKKEFVMPLKTNRKLALSADDKRQGKYVRADEVVIEPNTVRLVYLEGVSFPLLLAKQVFTNKDGSTGVLYLVTSDTTLTYDGITSLYQKRWTIEPYHKSLKQNAALERSPAHTVTTQTNHIFASLCAFIKLEKLKLKTRRNHFNLRAHLYLRAIQSAFDALRSLRPIRLAA
jgi:DDE superfamily endonuclease